MLEIARFCHERDFVLCSRESRVLDEGMFGVLVVMSDTKF